MKDIELSKYLSYILRHKPESIGLEIDKEGWACLSELIELSAKHGKFFTEEDVFRVVDDNDKQRFKIHYMECGHAIRASQGHSTDKVKLKLPVKVPPVVLYHGTATRFAEVIREEGLKPMSRQHVHLSADVDTAENVGKRHGKPIILEIDAKAMLADGIKFYQSENGVWLTERVPPQYLK